MDKNIPKEIRDAFDEYESVCMRSPNKVKVALGKYKKVLAKYEKPGFEFPKVTAQYLK